MRFPRIQVYNSTWFADYPIKQQDFVKSRGACCQLEGRRKDLRLRYHTALDLAEDMRRLREREPILAQPAGPALRFRRWTQRNPVLATAVLGLFVVLAAAFTITLAFLQTVRRKEETVRSERDQKAVALIEKDKALDGERKRAPSSSWGRKGRKPLRGRTRGGEPEGVASGGTRRSPPGRRRSSRRTRSIPIHEEALPPGFPKGPLKNK